MGNIWEKISNGIFVIAEVGKGFIQSEDDRSVEEYLDNAKKLALAAKESGADAVKYQTHILEDEQLNINVTSPHFKGSDRYSWVARNEKATPFDKFWQPLKKYCDDIGITFFTTPMSRGAAKMMNDLVDFWKVGSGDLLDFVMLDYMAGTKKPIIISTGMSSEDEIDLAVKFLKDRKVNFVILHCVSKYPCPPEELNLGTIAYLKEKYQVPAGFSDHSVGDEGVKTSTIAVKLGAVVIEKHFSFSRDLWGSDHKASTTPEEFKKLVENIRNIDNISIEQSEIDKYLGTAGKKLQEGEAIFRPYFRKSLMAGRDIKVGEKVTANMIYAMRPQAYAEGLPSEEYEKVLGRKSKKSLKKYDPITLDLLV